MNNKHPAVVTGHAEKCPVCEGEGFVAEGKRCRGCLGKGWIILYDKPIGSSEGITSKVAFNDYGDEKSPLFGKGEAPIYHDGCPPNCHTGLHSHHGYVPYIYGAVYDKVCSRCGHKAAIEHGSGLILCDCCMEDWSEIYSPEINIKQWVGKDREELATELDKEQERLAKEEIEPDAPIEAYKFDSIKKDLYLDHLRKGYTRGHAATLVGINRSTVCCHIRADKAFGEAVSFAESNQQLKIENKNLLNSLGASDKRFEGLKETPEVKLICALHGRRFDSFPAFPALLDKLAPRVRRVIKLRFGFEGGQSLTLQEIANEFGVARERIRQIEAEALRELRFRVLKVEFRKVPL